MRASRTPLVNSIRQAYRRALLSNKKNIPVDEVAEWEAATWSRRKFIRNSTGAAALTALSGTAFLTSCTKQDPPVIAIVGAGIAGLYAGKILRDAGVTAQIYESSNRTGGRIFTARNMMGLGLNTELGAEFIDSTHRDVLRLAKDFNLSLLDTHDPEERKLQHATFFIGGRMVTDRELLEMFSPFAQRIQEDIEKFSDRIAYNSHNEHDVMIDRMSLAEYLQHIGVSGVLYTLIDVAYTTEYGLDIEEQSAINFLMLIDTGMTDRFHYSGISDERYKIIGGNQSITDSLSDLLDGQIHTDKKLVAIRTQQEGDKVVLEFASKGGGTETVVADHVILTLPFSVLREVEIDYPLPEVKRKAIQELGYGQNAKFFLGFNKKVWRDQGYTGFTFTDTIAQNTWDNTQLQQGEGAGYTVFTGGAATGVMAAKSEAEFAADSLLILEKVYPGITATHTGKTGRFIWPAYPHAKASYACFRPGQFTTLEGAQSEPAGRIRFAGEHCSFQYQGFMNGAAETGRLAAEDILAAIA